MNKIHDSVAQNLNIIHAIQVNTMPDTTISLRIEKALHAQMKRHEELNWSAILRKAIVEELDKTHIVNIPKARAAFKSIVELSKKMNIHKGKSTTEIIREWRDKRK